MILEPIPPFAIMHSCTLQDRIIVTHLLTTLYHAHIFLFIYHHISSLALIMLFVINLGPPLGLIVGHYHLNSQQSKNILAHAWNSFPYVWSKIFFYISCVTLYHWHHCMSINVSCHIIPFMIFDEDITIWAITTSGFLFVIPLGSTIGWDYHGF